MTAVGVIAEYNPLHRGHLRHLALTRAQRPEDTVVVCMSGNWVQRGDCAVTDKWTRSAWAVRGGADLVLELPTAFALSSAETFAQGGVSILAAAGVSALSFGCEDAQLTPLRRLASALTPPFLAQTLPPYLAQGLSYPAARQKAAAEAVGADIAQLLEKPNNNLAVEYLRALPDHIEAIPIPRETHHDGTLSAEDISAAPLRRLLRAGQTDQAAPYLAQPWEGSVFDLKRLERAILATFRQVSPQELEGLPGGGDGLAQRLCRAAETASTLEGLWESARTRRLTAARIRRFTLQYFLGICTESDQKEIKYLRVLAMNEKGAAYLAQRKGGCPLPLIPQPAHHKALLAQEARLTDLFSLGAPTPSPPGRNFAIPPPSFRGIPPQNVKKSTFSPLRSCVRRKIEVY